MNETSETVTEAAYLDNHVVGYSIHNSHLCRVGSVGGYFKLDGNETRRCDIGKPENIAVSTLPSYIYYIFAYHL